MDIRDFKNYLSGNTPSPNQLVYGLIYFFIFLKFILDIYNQYNLYSWANFPLGWDSVFYAANASIIIEKGGLLYLLQGTRFYLYNVILVILGEFFPVTRLQIIIPILFSIVYAVLSSFLVKRYTGSRLLALLSSFISIFSIRNCQLVSMFNANLLFFIFLILFSVLLPNSINESFNLKSLILVGALMAFSHLFSSLFFGFSFLFFIGPYYHLILDRVKKTKIFLYFIPIFFFVVALNYQHIFFLLDGFVNGSLSGDSYWFHSVNWIDYTQIYNRTTVGACCVIVSSFVCLVFSSDNSSLRFLSIFSCIVLLFPIPFIFLQYSIPPVRILLLCQYQVMIPVAFFLVYKFLNLDIRLISGRRTFYFNPRFVVPILGLVLFLMLFSSTMENYRGSVEVNFKPHITESSYNLLKELRNKVDLGEIVNPVLVYYGSPGHAKFWDFIADLTLGVHYSYYGLLEDARELTPPDELSYLDGTELVRARFLFSFDDYDSESQLTFVVFDKFYGANSPDLVFIDGTYIEVS